MRNNASEVAKGALEHSTDTCPLTPAQYLFNFPAKSTSVQDPVHTKVHMTKHNGNKFGNGSNC